jgi:putative ABC transport system permease protein
MDAEVLMTFSAAIEVLNNLYASIPLSFAQSLYDTKGADRVNILLKNNRHTALTQKHLQTTFSANGLATEILTWEELRPSYLRIKNMFNVIFSFVFFIVMVIVVLSVINTISMAVVERTRETGTLRALGLKRSGVIKIFALESAMLAGIGSFAGLLLTILGWAMVVYFKPTWIPPTIPTKVPLEIHLVPGFLIFTTISMIVLATGAAIISARRASQMSIIDALGHI